MTDGTNRDVPTGNGDIKSVYDAPTDDWSTTDR